MDFDQPVHNIRAIAIMLIVGVHCAVFLMHPRFFHLSADEKNFYTHIFSILLSGGTHLFIIISGYLSHKIHARTPYIVFITKKIKHIVLPYLFFSLLFLAISYIKFAITGVPWDAVPKFDSCYAVVDALLCGNFQPHYWYIPFICVVFLFAPLILRLRKSVLYNITLISIVFPVIFPLLGEDNISFFALFFSRFIYYFPGFLLGMLLSSCKEEALQFAEKHLVVLVCIFVIPLLLFVYTLTTKSYVPAQYSTVTYIRCICLFMILFYAFNKFSFSCKLFDLIAENSFTIYFIHFIVIHTVFWRMFNVIARVYTGFANILCVLLISTLSVFVLSLLCSMVMRALLKPRARYFIG